MASITIVLFAYSLFEAYSKAYPFSFTASKTISKLSFYSSDKYFIEIPFYLIASKIIYL